MHLANRRAMSPMTCSRAVADGTPNERAAEYYAPRAALGLLLTEPTQPSQDGQGYLNTPGIHSSEHVEGWRKVSTAVHAAGGHLLIRLMHAGRMSHPDNTPRLYSPPTSKPLTCTADATISRTGSLLRPARWVID